MPIRYRWPAAALSLAAFAVSLTTASAQLPPGVTDSQKAGDRPTSPAESLKKITLPPGFRAQLFAAEPQVMQPIAMEFDDRGRLWVVENFSYPALRKNNGVTNPTPDRVVIFTDKSGTGQAAERKVFLDAGRNVTSVLPGFGGVWILSLPDLLFIPDANGDDVPDGPPVVALTGWNINAGHNFVNGLAWGPDGWLWGRHGITTKSIVGRPGSPTNDWVTLDCSIWRYHPVTKKFETVTRGTTNPWGLDWDENGQAFFSNNVIGHFWHVIPGAFYKRMFGTHENPHLYELMEACSDHLHWAGAKWSEARGGPAHDALGGGHSHCGLMIYHRQARRRLPDGERPVVPLDRANHRPRRRRVHRRLERPRRMPRQRRLDAKQRAHLQSYPRHAEVCGEPKPRQAHRRRTHQTPQPRERMASPPRAAAPARASRRGQARQAHR
jgi:putative membrane-bound dehydrogenase-like protein